MLERAAQRLATLIAEAVVARLAPTVDALVKAEFARFNARTMAMLHEELEALRAELQAERAMFAHGLEQLRQSQEVGLRHALEQGRDTAGGGQLAETLDAALLTLALNKQAL